MDKDQQFILEDLFTSKEWSNLQNSNQTYTLGRNFKKIVDLNVLLVDVLPGNGGTQRYKKL